ncbi:MAG: 30S ribosomal protein S9 [Candidatus Acidiferrales bacterium]
MEQPGEGVTKQQFYGTGRRKEAVARVYVRLGSGKFMVNGRTPEEYFRNVNWRTRATQPLAFTETATQLDVLASVHGGGAGGQADALRMGLSRALAAFNAELRPGLRRNGFLTRDSRMKERKKYGQKGARKRFQFSKR